ncbi:MAG: ribosome silencing factor [Leptospira sp.]|nr:ribosome silencing factor [Leptospira sp.]
MKKTKEVSNSTDTKKILSRIQAMLKEKKCEDITILNLEEVNSYLSYFVLCNVSYCVQAKAVSRELENNFKSLKLGPGNQDNEEKGAESGWILIDFGEILVHIMTPEKRHFYDLDRLWGDAKVITVK